jgi:hypothetical protein
VTTILGLTPKPGLPFAAARETAMFAYLHREKWEHLPIEEAVGVMRNHFRGIWNGRAAMGTLCHGVNEAFVRGEDVDIEHLVAHTIETDSNARTWAEQDRTDLIESCLGYVLGIEKWWAEFAPRVTAAEEVVRVPGKYIGQFDMRATIDGDDFLLDIKSTARQDDGTGIYTDSWLAQLNAYAWATEMVHYETFEERGRTRVRESGTSPWTLPQRLGVIHLRGDEEYTFFELPLTEEARDAFLKMAEAYDWLRKLPKEPTVVRPRVASEEGAA